MEIILGGNSRAFCNIVPCVMWHNNPAKEDSKNTTEKKELYTQEWNTASVCKSMKVLTWRAKGLILLQEMKERPLHSKQVQPLIQTKWPSANPGKTYLCQDIWEVRH
jgi:hypothetical protein